MLQQPTADQAEGFGIALAIVALDYFRLPGCCGLDEVRQVKRICQDKSRSHFECDRDLTPTTQPDAADSS